MSLASDLSNILHLPDGGKIAITAMTGSAVMVTFSIKNSRGYDEKKGSKEYYISITDDALIDEEILDIAESLVSDWHEKTAVSNSIARLVGTYQKQQEVSNRP